jgi:hypothetical protein
MTIDTMMLLAYLDGQLEHEADYERVEQALQQDAGMRERLQALVQQSATIRSAYRAKLEEPVPPQLVAAILNAPWPQVHAQAAGQRSNPQSAVDAAAQPAVAADPAQPGPWRRLWRHWVGALLGGPSGSGNQGGARAGAGAGGGASAGAGRGAGAAAWAPGRLLQGVALASLVWVVLVLWVWPQAAPTAPRPHWAQSGAAVHDERVLTALQAVASAQVVRIGTDTLEVLGSFERAPGQHCREVQELRQSAGAQTQTQTLAVLCQTPDRGWAVAFAASETVPVGAFETASGAQQAALQAFYDGLGTVQFLSADEENARLTAGWQGPAPRP